MTNILRFLRDESGATAIEYGLLAALIAGAHYVGVPARQHAEPEVLADCLGDQVTPDTRADGSCGAAPVRGTDDTGGSWGCDDAAHPQPASGCLCPVVFSLGLQRWVPALDAS